MINNYQLTLLTDSVKKAQHIGEIAKNLELSLKPRKNYQEELNFCNTSIIIDNDLISKNNTQIQFFHDITNILCKANNIIEKTKNNVENYLGMSNDILYFESLTMSTLSFLLSEFRFNLENLEAKKFEIFENDRKNVKLLNEILQKIAE